MAAKNRKNELLPKIIEMTNEGMTAKEAAEQLEVHPVTVQKWCRQEGITLKKNKTGRPSQGGPTLKDYTCEYCGIAFQGRPDVPRRFCSREHGVEWRKENQISTKVQICPCGNKVERYVDGKPVYHNKKYCDTDCRKRYADYRKADPSNYVSFICQNDKCGIEVTRPRTYGQNKYCSRPCADKHTKKKQHIVVENADVLDSKTEAFFWGLCGMLKIQVERHDRDSGVYWEEGKYYAPDFSVNHKGRQIAVEIKGYADEHDQLRWDTFRTEVGPLAVLIFADLEKALRNDFRSWFMDKLDNA